MTTKKTTQEEKATMERGKAIISAVLSAEKFVGVSREQLDGKIDEKTGVRNQPASLYKFDFSTYSVYIRSLVDEKTATASAIIKKEEAKEELSLIDGEKWAEYENGNISNIDTETLKDILKLKKALADIETGEKLQKAFNDVEIVYKSNENIIVDAIRYSNGKTAFIDSVPVDTLSRLLKNVALYVSNETEEADGAFIKNNTALWAEIRNDLQSVFVKTGFSALGVNVNKDIAHGFVNGVTIAKGTKASRNTIAVKTGVAVNTKDTKKAFSVICGLAYNKYITNKQANK